MTTVRLFAAAAEAAGAKERQTSVTSLADLRAELAASSPALAEVMARCSFLVDGLAVRRDEDRPLAGVLTVDVLPPFAGG
jgi:molybdopterin synthase sulfur carrier subunit